MIKILKLWITRTYQETFQETAHIGYLRRRFWDIQGCAATISGMIRNMKILNGLNCYTTQLQELGWYTSIGFLSVLSISLFSPNFLLCFAVLLPGTEVRAVPETARGASPIEIARQGGGFVKMLRKWVLWHYESMCSTWNSPIFSFEIQLWHQNIKKSNKNIRKIIFMKISNLISQFCFEPKDIWDNLDYNSSAKWIFFASFP